MIITKLRQDADGVWHARISDGNGHTVEVDRRYGAWHAIVPRVPGSTRRVRRDVLPQVAAALQDRVRPLEKKQRKQEEEQT